MRWRCARKCQCCRLEPTTSFGSRRSARPAPAHGCTPLRSLRNTTNRRSRKKRQEEIERLRLRPACSSGRWRRSSESSRFPAPWEGPSGSRSSGDATKADCGPHVHLACVDRAGIKATLRARRLAYGNRRRPGEVTIARRVPVHRASLTHVIQARAGQSRNTRERGTPAPSQRHRARGVR